MFPTNIKHMRKSLVAEFDCIQVERVCHQWFFYAKPAGSGRDKQETNRPSEQVCFNDEWKNKNDSYRHTLLGEGQI